MAEKDHMICARPFIHGQINLQYPDASNRVAGTGEVNGVTLTSDHLYQVARQQDDDSYWILTGVGPIVWQLQSANMGANQIAVPGAYVAYQTFEVTQTVPGSSSATTYFDLGLTEGCVFQVTASVILGTCNDADLELAASAYGTPTNLYRIGQDASGNPRWDPGVDGDWIDRNPWGFRGLAAGGRMYYKLSNNDAGAVDFRFWVYVIGVPG